MSSSVPTIEMVKSKFLKYILYPFLAIVIALLIGTVIILSGGNNPTEAYSLMFEGSLGSPQAIAETVVKTASLTIVGLSYAFAYRCGMLNIGIEGQMLAGAIFSTWAGIHLSGVPSFFHLILSILAGILAGAAVGSFIAYLKNRFSANEVITTVMVNYIMLFAVEYLVNGPMREAPEFPQSARVAPSAELPILISGTRVNMGILFALVLTVLYGLFWKKSKLGFEMRIVGTNHSVAKSIGINVNRSRMIAFAISGGLGGLVGSLEILGIQKRLLQSFSAGYGFDEIAVALLGKNSPLGILFSSLLFGIMKTGGNMVQMFSGVPSSVVMIIQAVIILMMTIEIFHTDLSQ